MSSKFSGDGSSKLGAYEMMVVLSGSMSPHFNAGDVIIVSTSKLGEYNVGDVITFKDPEDARKIVTHRVAEVQKNGNRVMYRTKGDANSTADPKPVPGSNIIGLQKWSVPYFGKVIEFTKTKQGLILLIILPGILIIASEIRVLAKAMNYQSEENKREVVADPWSRD